MFLTIRSNWDKDEGTSSLFAFFNWKPLAWLPELPVLLTTSAETAGQ